MPPSTDSPPDTDHPLRRQLILAQVQLMELEDTRDDLQARLASATALLGQAQQQADRALLEQDNLAAQLHDQQAALAAARAEAAALRVELGAARERERTLVARTAELVAQFARVERVQRDTDTLLAARDARLAQLEQERRAMQSSRSWRYTAPLRSLERALRRGGRAG